MMRTTILLRLVPLAVALLLAPSARAQLFPNLGGQRAGISNLTFLKNDVSPRSVGMGGASAATPGDAYAFFTNPAAAVDNEYLSFALSNTIFPADVHHSFLSATLPTDNGDAFTLAITSLTTGEMERRTEFQPQGTGEYFSATNLAAGFGYAKRLSNMFSFGLNLKYVYEQLAEYRNHTGAVDLGFLYRTDFKDLKFAVVLQHFGTSSGLDGDFMAVPFNRNRPSPESYPSPTVFKIGVSAVPWQDGRQSITTSLQLNHPNDNAENLRLGVEYQYEELLFLRAGYRFNVLGQRLPVGGVGVRTRLGRHPLRVDYAINPTDFLGILHTAGLTFSLNRQDRSTE